MSISRVFTRAQMGVESAEVVVETHLSPGLPSFSVVGLPETVVRESKDRVRSAIINSGFEFPLKRITVNLAPANLPKQGSCFDLPIALSILAASKQVQEKELHQYEFVGELALDGQLRSILGVLPAMIAANKVGRLMIAPEESVSNITIKHQLHVIPAVSLLSICAHVNKQQELMVYCQNDSKDNTRSPYAIDMADIKEQRIAKRALEVAAAGGHNILFNGPPGSGKTLLAKALPSILPPMTAQETLSTACIYSVQSKVSTAINQHRQFRAPHHSASAVALIGGGAKPKPGEISLAHNGVLFLDELPEFDRRALDMLREPLEEKCVHISRANYQITYPASFQLVAAMNPCPCGFLGDPERSCGYTCDKAKRYQSKLSGPLLDRIDIKLSVQPVKNLLKSDGSPAPENSESIRQRVCKARERQMRRQECTNAQLHHKNFEQFCKLSPELVDFLQMAMDKMQFTARAAHKIIKVARTIADLDNAKHIEQNHLYEAISYRN